MKLLDTNFMRRFLRTAEDGWLQGWHERNGGNLSYRLTAQEREAVDDITDSGVWHPIGTQVPELAGEWFLVTGSGKYFRNAVSEPDTSTGLIRLDEAGENYTILWGLADGGRPTSELPTHLMNHQVKRRQSEDYRVIYHAHPANLIALTFVLPLTDEDFTRELWTCATECPVVFPDGVGVVPWMVPGGRDIAIATSALMERYDAAVWAHHGLFCAGPDFDTTFGLMHTIEKSAEILVKVLSMGGRRQGMTSDDLRALACEFRVTLPERFLK